MLTKDYAKIPEECLYMFPPIKKEDGTEYTREELKQKIYTERAPIIYFGFECGEGWYSFIMDALKKIAAIDTKKEVRVIQIKQKFGTLRLYTDFLSTTIYDAVYEVITEAERLSAITCEQCGEPGKLRGKGWVTTLCDSCQSKRK